MRFVNALSRSFVVFIAGILAGAMLVINQAEKSAKASSVVDAHYRR